METAVEILSGNERRKRSGSGRDARKPYWQETMKERGEHCNGKRRSPSDAYPETGRDRFGSCAGSV
jgi:hypothetical protein